MAAPSASVLIVKRKAPGDVLRTTSLLPTLAQTLGPIKVTWVTEREAFPLLEANPYLERVFTPAEARALAPQLLFDFAFNPDADITSASLLTQVRAKIKRGIALDEAGHLLPLNAAAHAWFQMGLFDDLKRSNQKTYPSLLLEMAELPPPTRPPTYFFTSSEWQERQALLSSLSPRKRVGIFTGAGRRWEYKKWTEEGMTSLIELLLRENVEVLLLGGPQEESLNLRLHKRFPKTEYPGVAPLRRFALTLSLLDLLVCGDTLPLHLATALHLPVIALFGPTSAAEIELYERGEKIAPPLDCLGCYLPKCHRKPYCMELISANTVFQAIKKWLPL